MVKRKNFHPDPKYRVGLWQKEFLARLDRIYIMKGANACAWYNLHGLNAYIYNKELRKMVRNYKLMNRERDYFLSAVKLMQAGYIALYEYCGPSEDRVGFVPAWAPEAAEAALRRKGSPYDHPWVVGVLEIEKAKKKQKRGGGSPDSLVLFRGGSLIIIRP